MLHLWYFIEARFVKGGKLWSVSSLTWLCKWKSVNFFRQTLAAIPADVLDQVKSQAENFDVIGIDEGQFVSW